MRRSVKAVEVITARGHGNILATNKHTFEITKDKHVTKRGNCIIAVAADKGINDLSDEIKMILRKPSAKLTIAIQAGGEKEIVQASGGFALTFNHATDIVVRKSSYACCRTIGLNANKAAQDFPRQLVAKLRDFQQRIEITLTAEDPA